MKKSINFPFLARGCLSVLLGLGLLWLSVTKVYKHYVTPRTLPYLYFAAVLLLIMGIYAFTQIHRQAHVKRYTPLLALLIPLLLLGYSTYDANQWRVPLFPQESLANDSATALAETYTMTLPAYQGRELHGYSAAEKSIVVPQEETYWWLSEIYNDPAAFVGFSIHTMGQVLTDPQYFPQGCFSPSRQLMTCCVADLFTIGFKCQYEYTDTLTDGEWISVTGKLAMVDMEEYQELRLIVDTAEPCDPPLEPYIYAY